MAARLASLGLVGDTANDDKTDDEAPDDVETSEAQITKQSPLPQGTDDGDPK